MGKLNVAKMANFMEIDVFVLVACPENTLINSKVFIYILFINNNNKRFLTQFV